MRAPNLAISAVSPHDTTSRMLEVFGTRLGYGV
jgi:hypothetical protein